ncbi:MAG: phosphatase PAP2 family protein [Gammaproteobacteria bacterium]|nr:MAG: phosphatase PAP2 family protein [Gammaproteobacteria bacterium]
MEGLLQDVLTWIALHPLLSGLLIFIIALLESLVVIGLLIPGAFLLFGVGALIATGSLQLYPTLAWTIAGAIVGDSISFLIGRHYHQRLRVVWPFNHYPALVNRGIDFFYRHGGKSVFMARFVGPVRPIVPAIAGMMDMGGYRFLLVDTIASLLWAPVYILPGMVFGASLGLAAEVAGRLVVLLVIFAGITWLCVELVRIIGRLVQPRLSALLERFLEWSRQHPLINPLAGSLLDPYHPEARGLAILSVLFFITLWLLLLISRQVLHGGFMGDMDNYIHHFMLELRTPYIYQLNVFITLLGSQVMLALVLATGSLWLLWQGCSKAAFHWIAVYVCTGILTYLLKFSAQIARPVEFYGGYSFPSAHTAIGLAVYGFLALLVARELPRKQRWLPYSVAGLLITAIAFSRLYLGVHWLSDILGGACLGLFWVALIGIAYDRHPAPQLPVRRFLVVTVIMMAVIGSWQVQQRFRQDLVHYAQPVEIRTITLAEWQSHYWSELPVYRVDLEGLNEQPMNIQWAGSLDYLEQLLAAQGWQPAAAISASSLMNWLVSEPDISSLPILPQVHDGQHHDLLMTSRSDGAKRLTVLRLWPANAEISDSGQQLWTGTVSYLYIDHSIPLITSLSTGKEFDAPLFEIGSILADRTATRMLKRTPPYAGENGWDGQVLLAWQKPP